MSKYTIARDLQELSKNDLIEVMMTEFSRRVSEDKAELEILMPLCSELETLTKQ